jgi:two-component system, chemotaxis family, sensor kinase Cph1
VLVIEVNYLLNRPLAHYVENLQMEEIGQKIGRWNIRDEIPVTLVFSGPRPRNFTATVHQGAEYLLMELEEVQEAAQQQTFNRVYQEIKYLTAALREAESGQEVSDISVLEIKQLSGFDRVILYRFDQDWNGTVVAEAREAGLEPYLHLRFPASDVPKQTRDLYFRNPYRLIPNRDFTPVKLVPVVNPLTRTFTDLSECTLRGVPRVHLEYLKNMGVAASMSTPIIVRNQLWGLISCHHQTPKYLPYELRSAFELISNVIAAQLAAKESEKALQEKSALDRIGARLVERMYVNDDFTEGLLGASPNLLDVLRVEGAALLYEGECKVIGKTPRTNQVRELVRWLQLCNVDKVWVNERLPAAFAQSQEYEEVASGLIALPISVRKGEYVLGFRPEVIQTVEWGGDPNQAIQFDPDSKTYHPRNSFATWKEKVKHTSLPWSPQETEVAENLRIAILERILKDKA